MTDIKKNKSKEVSDTTKVKYAIDFIEEMSWLLDSKKNLKLREIPEILRTRLLLSNSVSNAAEKYVSPNPNIHYLIGVLPRLFQDSKIFQKNEDIAGFANEVLGLKIARIEKRSKYELIGLIVCETALLCLVFNSFFHKMHHNNKQAVIASVPKIIRPHIYDMSPAL